MLLTRIKAGSTPCHCVEKKCKQPTLPKRKISDGLAPPDLPARRDEDTVIERVVMERTATGTKTTKTITHSDGHITVETIVEEEE